MKNRVNNDSANTVSLFPFLAVLLCTMGALLVLLVVLAQRAGERSLAEATGQQVQSATFIEQPSENAAEAKLLLESIEQARGYQQQLEKLREKGKRRLQEEQSRLSHLEEHTRRLEHELAKLSLVADQLRATEQNHSVDQQQAEQELARLEKLIEDTEEHLESLREQSKGKRSYAIVPYKGQNGTYRKPVYIECCKEGIILHPEGIEIQPSDLQVTSWSGNPLAAALRATRTYVNAQAAKRGDPEQPDPYPMLLVRPDGIRQYRLARSAITSWDSSYGYEFIDADRELQFPESADPVLAQEQEHAIMLSRERLQRLIRSAPRRFQVMQMASSGAGGGGGNSPQGYGSSSAYDGIGAGGSLSDGGYSGDSSLEGGRGEGSDTNFGNSGRGAAGSSDEIAKGEKLLLGEIAGEGSVGGGDANSKGASESGNSVSADELANNSSAGILGPRYGQPGGNAQGAQSSGGANTQGGSGAGGQASTAAGGTQGGSAGSSTRTAGGGGGVGASSQPTSIADSKGQNWAVKKNNQRSVPIRRPIQVVVRENQFALLPSRHTLGGQTEAGHVISLDQPMNQVSQEFVRAMRSRIEEWGLAGRGLHWRPVLKLNVGPGAEQTARQLIRLLENSGVEISPAETARAPQGGSTNATR